MYRGVLLLIVLIAVSEGQSENYFWHITDFHYDPDYWTTQESCNRNLSREELGRYGDYACDPPWELVKSSVEAVKEQGPTPDFIIWTGDNGPHPKNPDAMSTERVIEILENTTNLIKENFPDTPVYVTLGNHDYFPSSQMPGENNQVYDAAADLWSDWIDTEEAQQTFRKGGFYTKLMASAAGTKLRAVIANTNLYYSTNKATEGQEDPGGQYQWLNLTLSNARENGEKVHLLAHIPSGALELPGRAKWLRPADNKRFNDLVIKYGDIIVGFYSCHNHFDTFRVFFDSNDKPVSHMLIAPSVTPWRARLGNGIEAKAHNPGVRKVFYDKNQLHLLDIEQFWLDLPMANEKVEAIWKSLYHFRETYGVSNITAESLYEVLQGFKEYGSESFHDYFTYNSVNLDPLHESNAPCDCRCKIEHLCAIEFIDYDDYGHCMDTSTCDTDPNTGAESRMLSKACVIIVLFISIASRWLLF